MHVQCRPFGLRRNKLWSCIICSGKEPLGVTIMITIKLLYYKIQILITTQSDERLATPLALETPLGCNYFEQFLIISLSSDGEGSLIETRDELIDRIIIVVILQCQNSQYL